MEERGRGDGREMEERGREMEERGRERWKIDGREREGER